MKKILYLFLLLTALGFSKDDDEFGWQKEMDLKTVKKNDLMVQLNTLNAEIEVLKLKLLEKNVELHRTFEELRETDEKYLLENNIKILEILYSIYDKNDIDEIKERLIKLKKEAEDCSTSCLYLYNETDKLRGSPFLCVNSLKKIYYEILWLINNWDKRCGKECN